MWSSHGPYNHVHGSGGDCFCSTAGPDSNHQHFTATPATAAPATSTAARAGSAAAAGPGHATRTGTTEPAASAVPPGFSVASWEPVDSVDPAGNFPFATARFFHWHNPTTSAKAVTNTDTTPAAAEGTSPARQLI